jgi:hypothetical protein
MTQSQSIILLMLAKGQSTMRMQSRGEKDSKRKLSSASYGIVVSTASVESGGHPAPARIVCRRGGRDRHEQVQMVCWLVPRLEDVKMPC